MTKAKVTNKRKNCEIKFNNVKDALLCTPYLKGFDYGITEDVFLRELYCDPDFSNRINSIEREIQELKNREAFAVDEELLDLQKEKSKIQQFQELKQRFEQDLIENNWQGARYICGYSGSGKSTYLGHLLSELREKHHKVYKIDLAESVKGPKFLSGTWFNSAFKVTLCKFVSVLLQTLNSMIAKNNGENVEEYRKHMEKYYNFYHDIYKENHRFSNFFNIIKLFVNKNIPYYERHNTSMYEKLYEHISNELNEIFSINNEENEFNIIIPNVEMVIHDLLGLIALFAMADVAKKKGDNYIFEHKIIIAIDSLEHYIQNDVVFNADIVRICTIIDDFIANQNQFYKDMINYEFSSIFKFIVVFRDTTAKMMPNRNAEDNMVVDINVTEWFLPINIAYKRFAFYKKGNSKSNEKQIKALETIMNDDGLNHSFFDKLVEMHNFNKRRLFQYLYEALNDNAVEHYLELVATIDNYSKKLKDNTDKERNDYIKLIQAYKNAARSSIIRLLFNQIKNKEYFQKIYVEERNADNMGKSYARRILTYISGKKPIEERQEQNNYIGFGDLLNNCFRIENVVEPDIVIENVANVLFEMSNSSKDDTNWCQLVVIKFNDQSFNKDRLKEQLQSSINNIGDHSKSYGIKITSAGRFFLSKMADYEYFACRYSRCSDPLFFEDITSKKNRQSVLSNINIVKQHAFDCIDKVKETDTSLCIAPNNYVYYNNLYSNDLNLRKGFLYVNKNGNEITHVQRIIDNHISYLDQYRNHVLESKIGDEGKKEFSKNILAIMNEYIEKLKSIVNEAAGEEKVYYLGRYRDGDLTGRNFYEKFETKLKQAESNPTKIIWIQK